MKRGEKEEKKMELKLRERDNIYYTVSSYEERDIPKRAGFRWDPSARCWWTDDPMRALRLYEYADAKAKENLSAFMGERERAVAQSRATDAALEIPSPAGLSYLPYQRAGVAYAASRPRCLIADEMGLGKTIQAIGLINLLRIKTVLIICPNAVKINWQRELERWLVEPRSIGIANGKGFPSDDIVIINYDLTRKYFSELRSREWGLLVCDESHYLKNPKAQRTQYVLGKWDRDENKRIPPIPAQRTLFLTGTPILNRPIELWPIVRYAVPEGIGKNWKSYVTRYCNGYKNRYGWDVSGASHLDELQDQLRANLMIRRLKSDVLAELPAKIRQIVELPTNGCATVVQQEQEAVEAARERIAKIQEEVEKARKEGDETAYKNAVKKLREGKRAAFTEISKFRHKTALAKVPSAAEYILDVLESINKLVVFAHHHDVVDRLSEKLREAGIEHVTVTGEDAIDVRQEAVDKFQENKDCRVFIGTIGAAGVGLTLTAASHVVFVELDWTPARITQAEDRCHRIGQADSVLVQHLVLDGSIDAKMAQMLVSKQEILDKALDKEEEENQDELGIDLISLVS